jgi:hypothetical protein
MGLLYLTISNSSIFWCPERVCSNLSLKKTQERSVEKYNSKGYFNAKSEKRNENLQMKKTLGKENSQWGTEV